MISLRDFDLSLFIIYVADKFMNLKHPSKRVYCYYCMFLIYLNNVKYALVPVTSLVFPVEYNTIKSFIFTFRTTLQLRRPVEAVLLGQM